MEHLIHQYYISIISSILDYYLEKSFYLTKSAIMANMADLTINVAEPHYPVKPNQPEKQTTLVISILNKDKGLI